MPAPKPPRTTGSSRLSRQVHSENVEVPKARHTEEEEDEEMGMDVDPEDEDSDLYCFCQKPSYGEMIACDNEDNCPYEWVSHRVSGTLVPH